MKVLKTRCNFPMKQLSEFYGPHTIQSTRLIFLSSWNHLGSYNNKVKKNVAFNNKIHSKIFGEVLKTLFPVKVFIHKTFISPWRCTAARWGVGSHLVGISLFVISNSSVAGNRRGPEGSRGKSSFFLFFLRSCIDIQKISNWRQSCWEPIGRKCNLTPIAPMMISRGDHFFELN